MPILDIILVGAVIVFAWAGWRKGFVAGVLSLVGFLGGGILGALVLPSAADAFTQNEFVKVIIVLVGIIACAVIGQLLATILGSRIRSALTWKPIRYVDNAAGAVVNVIALALVVWIIAMVASVVPSSAVTNQVNSSRMIVTLDSLMPAQVRNVFSGARNLVSQTDVPRVFAGIAQVTGPQVPPPDDGIASGIAEAVRGSIVRVSGSTPECDGGVSGSGFVIAPEIVATNAHVVAGVERPLVRLRASDSLLPGTVIHFDPNLDIALIDVPGLRQPALPLLKVKAATGDDAVVAGFPESGPFVAQAARVRALMNAVGDDIYGTAGVEREIYVLRTSVRPGNSGGPLVDGDGRVMGMVFGSDKGEEQTAYAISARHLRDAVDGSGSERVDTGTCRLAD